MLPFSLKVVWFCLSFSGIIACWVVQCVFSRAIGSYWGPMLYSVFATLLEGIFCLGMIYGMDPYRMPKTFCILQTFVIYYSAWSLTGVCAAFTFATSSPILWPASVKRATSTLGWQSKYYVPIFVFPLVCLSISVPVLLRVDAIQPTDDLYCDASRPEWGRFLGYAGLSVIPTVPCFFISVSAVRRIIQLHRDNRQLSFKNGASQSRSRPQLGNGQTFERPDSTTLGVALHMMPSSSRSLGTVDIPDGPDLSLSSFKHGALSHEWSEIWEVIPTIENDGSCCVGQVGGVSSSATRIVPLPRPNLGPAIWRLILFQMSFFIVQCLAALSTVIDIAQRRPAPTPFGSQHVALVLVGWGPAFVFGHLPAVRRRLMFWKK